MEWVPAVQRDIGGPGRAGHAFWPGSAFFPPAQPFVAAIRATFDDAGDCCSVQVCLPLFSVFCWVFYNRRKAQKKSTSGEVGWRPGGGRGGDVDQARDK